MRCANRQVVVGNRAAAVCDRAVDCLVWISVGLTPAGASGPLGTPRCNQLLLWLGALLVTLALAFSLYVSRITHHSSLCFLLLAACELFFATRPLTLQLARHRARCADESAPVDHVLAASRAGGHTARSVSLDLEHSSSIPVTRPNCKSIFGDQLVRGGILRFDRGDEDERNPRAESAAVLSRPGGRWLRWRRAAVEELH